MKAEYKAYLAELVAERRSHIHPSVRDELTVGDVLRAQCQAFSREFVGRFPHLRIVVGFYGSADVENCEPGFGYVEHWWCVDVDGTIVDPTAAQFRTADGTYTVFDETKHRIRLGRCMNCGNDIYGLRAFGRQDVCGEECAKILENHYANER